MVINSKVDVMSIKMVCDDLIRSFEHELLDMDAHSTLFDMADARYQLFLTGSSLQSLIDYWVTFCNSNGFLTESSELVDFRDQCFQQIIIYYKRISKNLSDKVI